MSFRGNLLRAGIDSDGKVVTVYRNDGRLDVATASSVATGTRRSANIVHTVGAANTGVLETLRASLASEYKTGSWANAIVGRIDYGTTGDSTGGMAAAICGEINIAAKDMHNLGGAYYCFDAEINVPTSCVLPTTTTTRPVAFFNLAAWGGAVGEFDDKGFLFHTDGLTAGAGHLLSANTRTLRVNIEGALKYIYLSDTEDDLGAMVMDSITFSDGGTIADASDVMTITDETITLVGSTGIILNGALTFDDDGTLTDVSDVLTVTQDTIVLVGAITLDGAVTLDNGATVVDGADNGGELVITQDMVKLVGSGYGKIQFGGPTDWGVGATGQVIDGTGWDWVTQTVGVVNSGALATACAAAYHALTVAPASHTTASSFFGTWTELYLQATQDMSNAANCAAVWGQIEAGATVTTTDVADCFVAPGYFNMISGATFVIQSGIAVNGVRVQSEVATSGFSNSGRFAAFEALAKAGCQDWEYGLYIAGSDTAIGIADGFDHGIRFLADPAAGDSDNSFINMGTYADAIAVAPTSDHMFGVMHNVTLAVNVAKWYQAYYTKITTSGTTTQTSVAGDAIRMMIGSSLGAAYGIQCHMTLSGTNTISTEAISVSAYVNLAAAAAITTDRVCALQAMIEGAGGTVTGDSVVAYFVNAGTASDTDSILELKNQSACTVGAALTMDLDGTCTYAIDFDGTVPDAWTTGDGAVTQADEYVKIPVKVAGVTPTLYILAAETWT